MSLSGNMTINNSFKFRENLQDACIITIFNAKRISTSSALTYALEIIACFFGSTTTSFVALDVESEQFTLPISSGYLGLKYRDCNRLVTFFAFALWWFLPFMWEIMAEKPIFSSETFLLLHNLHTVLCLSVGSLLSQYVNLPCSRHLFGNVQELTILLILKYNFLI